MAVIGQGLRIELPALEPRPWGLFIDVVPEIKLTDGGGVDRGAFGAKWMADGVLAPILVDFGCDTPDDLDTGNMELTERETPAYSVWNLLSCSTISEDPSVLRRRLLTNARQVESEALAEGATTQITVDHLNLLDDSDLLSASASIGVAVAKVEGALADRISNDRGYIFIPLELLQPAFQVQAVSVVNGRLVSPAGHHVISDAGHGANNIVFGTGEMGFYLSPIHALEGGELERDRNIITLWEQRFAVIMFNPAHSVRTVTS